jgi:hypothetical protein
MWRSPSPVGLSTFGSARPTRLTLTKRRLWPGGDVHNENDSPAGRFTALRERK